MGLLDIFKKKPRTAIMRPKQPSVKQVVDQVYHKTEQEIMNGLSKPTASTGKPMDELHGAAKTIAQISNIGGGSKETGGGGIDKGLDTLRKHVQARTAKTMLDRTKQKKLGKK